MNALHAIALESVQSVHPRDVMKTAWELAKLIACEYHVSAKSLLSAAFKKVWANVRVKVSIEGAYESRKTLSMIGFTFNDAAKAWEKTMKLGEFNHPEPVRYGRGFITANQISSAFAHKHHIFYV